MATVSRPDVIYPESDGKRMAENTLQFQWIVMIKENVEAIFRDDPNVFVAGDLLWYPVEGEPSIVRAPDAMVALGRPRGHRKSYKQWEENDVAPQVVFEILSESNEATDIADMEDFYETYGVEEFYWYDPRRKRVGGMRRNGGVLVKIRQIDGWISPLLKIRFETKDDLVLYRPDGQRFMSYQDISKVAILGKQRAEQERQRAEQERQRAEQERQRAERAEARVAELLRLLQEKGIDPS